MVDRTGLQLPSRMTDVLAGVQSRRALTKQVAALDCAAELVSGCSRIHTTADARVRRGLSWAECDYRRDAVPGVAGERVFILRGRRLDSRRL